MEEFISNFLDTPFTIPMNQLLYLVTVISVFLILGKHKLGLIGAYGFTFYWIFIMQRAEFTKMFSVTNWGVYFYGFCSIFMLVIGVVGFLRKDE